MTGRGMIVFSPCLVSYVPCHDTPGQKEDLIQAVPVSQASPTRCQHHTTVPRYICKGTKPASSKRALGSETPSHIEPFRIIKAVWTEKDIHKQRKNSVTGTWTMVPELLDMMAFQNLPEAGWKDSHSLRLLVVLAKSLFTNSSSNDRKVLRNLWSKWKEKMKGKY